MTKNQAKLNKCKERWKERDVQFSVNLVRVGSNLSRKKKSLKKEPMVFDADTKKEAEVFEESSNIGEQENDYMFLKGNLYSFSVQP